MTPEVRIEDFYGHHALAAGLPPKQLFERVCVSFAWAAQREVARSEKDSRYFQTILTPQSLLYGFATVKKFSLPILEF
jgi:hypothetical protein